MGILKNSKKREHETVTEDETNSEIKKFKQKKSKEFSNEKSTAKKRKGMNLFIY